MQKRVFLTWLFLNTFLVIGLNNAQAWVANVEKLANAQPQECYSGFGQREDPIGEDPFTCPESAQPYTPQTYVWSLTQYQDILWFGTGGNVLCTTQGAFFSEVDPDSNGSGVCEFGESWILDRFPQMPNVYGDWRPPKIYLYNLNTKKLVERTPYSDPQINRCFGLRSAGSHNGVVFFAGGKLGNGIIMFAYNGNTGQYLGSQTFSEYRSIRKWLIVNDQLYTGMGTTTGTGKILRWTGSIAEPFNFSVVGEISGLPRELVEYIDNDGMSRIAVSAKGIFLSPAIEGDGLTVEQRTDWQQIWSADEYEPDFVTRTTYVGGGIEFLNGWLYFGTMHIPGNAADLHATCVLQPSGIQIPENLCFGEPDGWSEELAIYYGTQRATSIWRIRDAESENRVTQLLYGEANLPAYDPEERDFDDVPNAGGYQPLLGSSGFGSDFNNYAWVMEVVDNRLFIGTMDFSTLYDPSLSDSGADLWRIDGTADDEPVAAVAETTNAFGAPEYATYTYHPYGFRTLIKSADGTRLFAGMASGVNVGAVDDGAGWQLLELKATETASLGDFSILAPSGSITTNIPNLSWSAADNAEFYDVSITTDTSCQNAVQSFIGITTTELTPSTPLEDGSYFLCVDARVTSGEIKAAANNALLFTVETVDFTPPGPFAIVSPSGSIPETIPEISWNDSLDAVSYNVTIASDAACTSAVQTMDDVALNSVYIPEPLVDGEYFTCVSSFDNAGNETQATNNGFAFSVDTSIE